MGKQFNEMEYPWRETEKQVIEDVINSRKLSMFSGQYLIKAENKLSSIYSGRKSLLLNSGTAAIHLAMKIQGIGPGDEVIVPAITYIATALAVKHAGATPVFADIDPNNFTLAPLFCKRLISKKTKAIIFVHLFGVPGNIEQVTALCKENKIVLIEDCAQAFGSEINQKKVGTFGDYACFSFFESKTISAGEGGALLLYNENELKLGRKYRHHGMDVVNNDRTVDVVGYNYKPSEFESAIIYAQLSHYKEILLKREEIVSYLKNQLNDFLSFQAVTAEEKPVIDKLCMIFNDISTRKVVETIGQNLKLFRYIRKPLYEEPIFKNSLNIKNLCPVSEHFCDHHLVLQITPYKNHKNITNEVNKIISNLKYLKS